MGCVELLVVVILLGGVEGGSGGSGGRTKFAAGFTGEFDFVFDFVFLFHDSCVLFLYSTRQSVVGLVSSCQQMIYVFQEC